MRVVAAALLVALATVAAAEECDPWADAPDYTVTPVLEWDPLPQATPDDLLQYRIYRKRVEWTEWRLACSVLCFYRDHDNDPLTPGIWTCPTSVALQKCGESQPTPKRLIQQVVTGMNLDDNGDPQEGAASEIVVICEYPVCVCDEFGCTPTSCCDPDGPQDLCVGGDP